MSIIINPGSRNIISIILTEILQQFSTLSELRITQVLSYMMILSWAPILGNSGSIKLPKLVDTSRTLAIL